MSLTGDRLFLLESSKQPENFYTGCFLINNESVNKIANLALNPPIEHILFGDLNSWISSLIYYPKKPNFLIEEGGKLQIGGHQTEIEAESVVKSGLYLVADFGKIVAEDFTSYEPYTNYYMYLPFFGVCDISANDILNKYLYILQNVDVRTGQSSYYIYTTKEDAHYSYIEIEGVKEKIYVNSIGSELPQGIFQEENEGNLVSTYVAMIGTEIPLGSSNMSDNIRNIVLSSVHTAGSLIAGFASSKIPTETTTISKNTHMKTNPKTNRLKTQYKTKDITTTSSVRSYNPIPDVISSSTTALSNIQLKGQSDKPSNSILNSANSTSIILFSKKAIIKEREQNFNHLYGRPLGEIRKLNKVNGYTIISEIHIEGEGFENITEEEREELHTILTSGVILDGEFIPPEPQPNFQNLYIINYNSVSERYVFTMPENYTFSEFVGSEYDTSNGKIIIKPDGKVYFNNYNLFKTTSEGNVDVLSTDIASMNVYYSGYVPPTEQTFRLHSGSPSGAIIVTYVVPYGWTFKDFINSSYNANGYFTYEAPFPDSPNITLVSYRGYDVVKDTGGVQPLRAGLSTPFEGDFYTN